MDINTFLRCRYVDVQDEIGAGSLMGKSVIYLNPLNYMFLRNNTELLQSVHYCLDGLYFSFLFRLTFLRGRRIRRQPFDFTALAAPVFVYCRDMNLRVFLAGGTAEDVRIFQEKIEARFPGITICGSFDGYQNEETIISTAMAAKPDVVLLGLGNGKQERVAAKLTALTGCCCMTCGAFISQTASSIKDVYYPELINRLQLRWLYRFFNEPRVIKRVLIYYPLVLLYFAADHLAGAWNKDKEDDGDIQ